VSLSVRREPLAGQSRVYGPDRYRPSRPWATLEMVLPTRCGACLAPGGIWCEACAHDAGRSSIRGRGRSAPRPVPWVPRAPGLSARVTARLARPWWCSGRRPSRPRDGSRADVVGRGGCGLAKDPRVRAVPASGNGPVFVVPVLSSSSAVYGQRDAPLEPLTRTGVRQIARSKRELTVSPALRLGARLPIGPGATAGKESPTVSGRNRWSRVGVPASTGSLTCWSMMC
jgi:hypothetical protein